MKTIITFLLFLCSCNLYAQSYKITYDYIPVSSDNRKIKLIVTDSLCYQYIDLKGYAPKKNETVFGKKVVHHSVFYFPEDKVQYSTMGMDKKHPYMFIVHTPGRKWIPVTNTKIIEGYLCKGMLSVDVNGDSTLAFYTDELSKFGSPWFECNDIPGLTLEVNDQNRQFILRASKIEAGDYKIIFPSGIEVVSVEERNRRVLAERKNEN